MKRKGYISEAVATLENFERGFRGYSANKYGRHDIDRFAEHLTEHLTELLQAYATCNYRTSEYEPKEVFKPKHRIVHKSQVRDHVIQWSAMLPDERWLMDSFYYRSPACVPTKGTHYYVRQEQKELLHCEQDEVYYFVQIDVHHYFENIDHAIMKDRVRSKIKDPIHLHFLDEFIDSFNIGLVLGVKLSQILSGMYLAPFDRIALDCFGIGHDIEKLHYWQDRYVSACLLTCRTPSQAAELAKGVEYLNAKFESYIREGLRHYSRFADNITIKHRDKVFLHLMVELSIMVLERDFHLQVNRSWNVRPMWMGNDVCGYVFYHDHLMLRKRNKKALCRQVAKLRRKGYSERDIKLKCASRIGFASHADTRNLLKSLNMEKDLARLSKTARRKPRLRA